MDNNAICSAIEIHNLTKCYGSNKALDDVSFQVKKGEIMGFLGPNGAGKSTTMNIITGYINVSSGTVLVEGIDISENPIETKRKIGYLPELPPLYMEMTVQEYLRFVYKLKGVKGDREAHLKEIMEKVRIYDVRKRIINNLSKGYKQRVGIAQALVGNPPVLILDEPTVGLDPRQIAEIRDVIAGLGQERTVILSTHILQEVMAVCSSYTIINRGRIVTSGSMEEFSKSDSGSYRLRVKGSYEEAEAALAGVQGIAQVSSLGSHEPDTEDVLIQGIVGHDIRESIFKAFADAGYPILSFAANVRSLEDTFLRAISEATAKEEDAE